MCHVHALHLHKRSFFSSDVCSSVAQRPPTAQESCCYVTGRPDPTSINQGRHQQPATRTTPLHAACSYSLLSVCRPTAYTVHCPSAAKCQVQARNSQALNSMIREPSFGASVTNMQIPVTCSVRVFLGETAHAGCISGV